VSTWYATTRGRQALWHTIVAFAVTFVAFWRIGAPDAAGDERTYLKCGYNYVAGRVARCNFEHPPLAKEILGVGLHLFGDTLTVGRVTTSLVGVGTAVFLYLLVRDVCDWRWGLVAAALWGVSPQAGVENGVATHALRISRFALLDPYVCFFFAVALWAGWRYRQRGGTWWPVLTGVACAGAALSKEIGLVLAPSIIGLAVAHRWRLDGAARALRSLGGVLVGGAGITVLTYAPFGWGHALNEVHYLLNFQLHHVGGGSPGILAGHYYVTVPWWANLWYAVTGMGWFFSALVALGLLGALMRREVVGFFLIIPSVVVYVVIAQSHLAFPFYWIDFEPGLVAAAAIGLARAWDHRPTRVASSAAIAILAGVAGVTLLGGVATAGEGPYQRAARVMACDRGCTVYYVGFKGIFDNYVSGEDKVARPGGPGVIFATAGSPLVVPDRAGSPTKEPTYVLIDPASPLAYQYATSVHSFEVLAASLGYRPVTSDSRLLIWRRVTSK